MMENQILTTSFHDLKKALEKNYYDIYYPQKYYRNPKKFIREYEAYNIFYFKEVVPKLPLQHQRQSSLHVDMDTKLEKKWYHFVTCFFLHVLHLATQNDKSCGPLPMIFRHSAKTDFFCWHQILVFRSGYRRMGL